MADKYDLELCINTANTFFEIGKHANEIDLSTSESGILFKSDAFFEIPAIVNISFACELYLKALLIKEGLNYRGTHSLFNLFKKLQPNDRDQICKEYTLRSKYPMTIEDVMKIHEKSFVDWRYIFEEQQAVIEAYPGNLLLAAEVIREQLNLANCDLLE